MNGNIIISDVMPTDVEWHGPVNDMLGSSLCSGVREGSRVVWLSNNSSRAYAYASQIVSLPIGRDDWLDLPELGVFAIERDTYAHYDSIPLWGLGIDVFERPVLFWALGSEDDSVIEYLCARLDWDTAQTVRASEIDLRTAFTSSDATYVVTLSDAPVVRRAPNWSDYAQLPKAGLFIRRTISS